MSNMGAMWVALGLVALLVSIVYAAHTWDPDRSKGQGCDGCCANKDKGAQ